MITHHLDSAFTHLSFCLFWTLCRLSVLMSQLWTNPDAVRYVFPLWGSLTWLFREVILGRIKSSERINGKTLPFPVLPGPYASPQKFLVQFWLRCLYECVLFKSHCHRKDQHLSSRERTHGLCVCVFVYVLWMMQFYVRDKIQVWNHPPIRLIPICWRTCI